MTNGPLDFLLTCAAPVASIPMAVPSGRFFDKVTLYSDAYFSPQRDGPKLLQAAIAYQDRLALLYRFVNPRVRVLVLTKFSNLASHVSVCLKPIRFK